MMEKYSRVYASVDLDAFTYNLEQIKKNIGANTKIMGVIKADGYGHGAIPLANEMESMDFVCGYAVATAEEGMNLRNAGMKKPILILGYTFPYCYEEMITKGMEPAVFQMDTIKELSATVVRLNEERKKQGMDELVCKVHIKVDTGMSRIGIRPDEGGLSFVREVLCMPGIKVEGIFTHFAGADEADKTSAERQLKQFVDFTEQVESKTGYHFPKCHISNSAAIVELNRANLHMVRAGIILYGLWPSNKVSRQIIDLMPLMELKSHIVYVKEVEAGVPVSYGGDFVTGTTTKIATIPVGYGDGYPRGLSDKGYVLIRGKRAPIIGRICMDQFMVDVTKIEGVSFGDEVTLIGRDGSEQITMEEAGETAGRFNYEFACCIGKRVPRVYVKEGKIVDVKNPCNDFY